MNSDLVSGWAVAEEHSPAKDESGGLLPPRILLPTLATHPRAQGESSPGLCKPELGAGGLGSWGGGGSQVH